MLETIAEVFVPPPSDPGDRLKELGALPSDAMVPVEVLDLLWDSKSKEATSSLVEQLCDLGMVQFDRPETGSRYRERIRLHDSDREYFRKRYPDEIQKADQRLLRKSGQRTFDEPIVRDYLAEHRIWHLIGAHDYEGVVNALTSPESLVNAALDRGVRAVEYDLALALAHCSSELGGSDRLLRPLLSRIRQSIDLLKRCDSRESFCPTLAGRLQGIPELADFAVSLSRCVEDGIIQVEGPPHDMDDRRLVRRLPKRAAGMKALSWMAEPDRVGIAFRDGAVRLWDPNTNQLHQIRDPDSQPVTLAAWANSGGLIAIGRSDGTVTVWPLPGGDGLESLTDQGVAAVAWSRAGDLAYAGWAGALACWSRNEHRYLGSRILLSHRDARGGRLWADRPATAGAMAERRIGDRVEREWGNPEPRQCLAGAEPVAVHAVPTRRL